MTTPSDADTPTPSERPLRLLLRGLLWLLLAEAVSFCTSFGIVLVAALSQAGTPHVGRLWLPLPPVIPALAATVALQVTLLAGDLRQGRQLGHGDRLRGLGAPPVRRPRFVAGLVAAVILWVLLYVAVLIRFHAVASFVATDVPPALAPLPGSDLVLAVRMVLVVALAPVAEELFFRGWLWTGLRRSWGVWPTAVVTSAVWLSLHALGAPVRVPILVPTAILLCVARHYGGSVRASLAVHVANNATAMAIQVLALVMMRP
jgi:membrane protease YdiL (CAAX protease family)